MELLCAATVTARDFTAAVALAFAADVPVPFAADVLAAAEEAAVFPALEAEVFAAVLRGALDAPLPGWPELVWASAPRSTGAAIIPTARQRSATGFQLKFRGIKIHLPRVGSFSNSLAIHAAGNAV